MKLYIDTRELLRGNRLLYLEDCGCRSGFGEATASKIDTMD